MICSSNLVISETANMMCDKMEQEGNEPKCLHAGTNKGLSCLVLSEFSYGKMTM